MLRDKKPPLQKVVLSFNVKYSILKQENAFRWLDS